jgi:prevent-host-death family protein
MESFGLRELRQNASELVRRAEEGEELLVTVSGRAAAILGPVTPSTWRTFDEIASIFSGPTDPVRATDRDRTDEPSDDVWLI